MLIRGHQKLSIFDFLSPFSRLKIKLTFVKILFLICWFFLAQSIKFLLTEKDKDFSFAWIIESLICGQNLDNIGLYEMCNV